VPFLENAVAVHRNGIWSNSQPKTRIRIEIGSCVITWGLKKENTLKDVIPNGSGRLFYTVPEVCKMLQVERKTVYRLIARGLLKTSSAIRHKRICSRSLEQFINTTVYGGAQ